MAQVLNDRIIKLLFFVVLMLHVISDGQTYTIISGMLNMVTLSNYVMHWVSLSYSVNLWVTLRYSLTNFELVSWSDFKSRINLVAFQMWASLTMSASGGNPLSVCMNYTLKVVKGCTQIWAYLWATRKTQFWVVVILTMPILVTVRKFRSWLLLWKTQVVRKW